MQRARVRSLLPLAILLAVALAIRLVFASAAPVFLEGDSQSYLLPAWELANDQGFSPELRRTPLYPLFIAGSFGLFGQDLDALALAQHALGLATVALTYLLGRRLFGITAGFLAGLAVAVSGPQLIYERYVMTEALFGLVLAATCFVLIAAVGAGTVRHRPADHDRQVVASRSRYLSVGLPLLAGLSIALAALARPVAQAILPLFLAALLLALPRWRPALTAAGLTLLGYALLVAPWTIRNAMAHDALTASGGLGRSLIARTVKYDTLFDWKWLSETYDERDDLPSRARILLYNKRRNIPEGRSVRPYQDALIRELGLSQGQADAMMREIALEAIARRPLDYLVGSLRFTGLLLLGSEERLQSHWKQRANKDWAEQWDNRLDHLVEPVAPLASSDGADGRGQPSTLGSAQQSMLADLIGLYQPSRFGWLLVALFAFGCLHAGRAPTTRATLLLGAVVVLMLALSAFLDGPVPRYRHPIDPLISILAAGGLVGGLQMVTAAGRRVQERLGRNIDKSTHAPSPARGRLG